jgi:hypothetical protein
MIMQKLTTVLALAVCLVALPALADNGKAVTRPHKGVGTAIIVVDTGTGTWEMADWGQGTHLGAWTDTANGMMDGANFGTGTGTTVAADGDTYDWVLLEGVVTFVGGTGRFAGVTGQGNMTITSQQDPVFNEDYSKMTVVLTFSINGEITY